VGDRKLCHEVTLLDDTRFSRWNGPRTATVPSLFVAYGDERVLKVATDYFGQAQRARSGASTGPRTSPVCVQEKEHRMMSTHIFRLTVVRWPTHHTPPGSSITPVDDPRGVHRQLRPEPNNPAGIFGVPRAQHRAPRGPPSRQAPQLLVIVVMVGTFGVGVAPAGATRVADAHH
jgi:hypothetical protein